MPDDMATSWFSICEVILMEAGWNPREGETRREGKKRNGCLVNFATCS